MRIAQCWEAGHVIEKQPDSIAQMSCLQAALKLYKNNLPTQFPTLSKTKITSPTS